MRKFLLEVFNGKSINKNENEKEVLWNKGEQRGILLLSHRLYSFSKD